jgi:hypothetical protein
MTDWGGARVGAGRPAKHAIASEPHKRRPELVRGHAVHVVARVVRAIASLRGHDAYAALGRALQLSLRRADFRIVQIAIRRRRLELVVEADDRIALARGMQGFQVSAARALNRACGRRGTVFADRYRARPLRTFAAVREVIGAHPPELAGGQRARVSPSELAGQTSLERWIAAAWPETALLDRATAR